MCRAMVIGGERQQQGCPGVEMPDFGRIHPDPIHPVPVADPIRLLPKIDAGAGGAAIVIGHPRLAVMAALGMRGEVQAVDYFVGGHLKTDRPAYSPASPSISSIRINWLYLQMRSVRQSEPVLICPALVATTTSAMVVSSVSPER